MNNDLHRWLDGEIDRSELPDELREHAVVWDRLREARAGEAGPAPRWIEARVMAELPRRAPGRRARALGRLGWLTRPRTIRVRPVTVGAFAAAAIAALLLWPGAPSTSTPAPGAVAGGDSVVRAAGTTPDGSVFVQFVYVAPEAGAVNVAGDFNEWNEQGFALRDPDGDGVWTGYLPLRPGLHKYMFVVDGEWVTDPRAERHVDDGFGNRNALISVVPPGSRI